MPLPFMRLPLLLLLLKVHRPILRLVLLLALELGSCRAKDAAAAIALLRRRQLLLLLGHLLLLFLAVTQHELQVLSGRLRSQQGVCVCVRVYVYVHV